MPIIKCSHEKINIIMTGLLSVSISDTADEVVWEKTGNRGQGWIMGKVNQGHHLIIMLSVINSMPFRYTCTSLQRLFH